MALAVTHILVTILVLDLLRHYVFGKEKFPRYLLIVGGIAGLAPDLDVPFGWLLSFLGGTPVDFHRVFTHSIFVVLLFVLLGTVRRYQGDAKWATLFYVVAAGWLIHLLLDCLYGGPITSLLWPTTITLSACPTWDMYPYAAGIDAILLVLWLVHEEVHQHIRDYI